MAGSLVCKRQISDLVLWRTGAGGLNEGLSGKGVSPIQLGPMPGFGCLYARASDWIHSSKGASILGLPLPADLRPRPMALRSVEPCDASAAAVKGGLRAVASSWLEAASELEEVEKAAAATFRELDATAGPEPSCLNAESETDLDANAMTMVLVRRGAGEPW